MNRSGPSSGFRPAHHFLLWPPGISGSCQPAVTARPREEAKGTTSSPALAAGGTATSWELGCYRVGTRDRLCVQRAGPAPGKGAEPPVGAPGGLQPLVPQPAALRGPGTRAPSTELWAQASQPPEGRPLGVLSPALTAVPGVLNPRGLGPSLHAPPPGAGSGRRAVGTGIPGWQHRAPGGSPAHLLHVSPAFLSLRLPGDDHVSNLQSQQQSPAGVAPH